MAQVTGKQKRQQTSFWVMLIAIIVVAAAIGCVLYEELTSKSAFLGNQDFAAALSENLGKAPAFIKEEDLAAIEFISANYDANSGVCTVITGKDGLAEIYLEYLDKADAGEDVSEYNFDDLINYSYFETDEKPLMDDVKYFTGAKIAEFYSVKFTDSSVFSGLTSLVEASVDTCGLTEVAGFAGLNAENVRQISLNNNSIEDWSPLDYIQDKVIVSASYYIEPAEDGTIDINNMSYVEQTLAEYYEELAAEAEGEGETSSDESSTDETTEETTDETASTGDDSADTQTDDSVNDAGEETVETGADAADATESENNAADEGAETTSDDADNAADDTASAEN